MNIEQYRAMKAQEESAAKEAQDNPEQPTVVEDEVEEPEIVDEDVVDETKIKDNKIEQVEVIEIDGEEVTIDELRNGYLRQSDYTKKTQEVARAREETKDAIRLYEDLKHNPQIVEQLKRNTSVPGRLDPAQAKVIELEEKMYDMMLENEIRTLESRYEDFEAREVLALASEKDMSNIEDAYFLWSSQNSKQQDKNRDKPVDVDKIKEDIRKEIMEEMENERSTKSIISAKGSNTAPKVKEVSVSDSEAKVAKAMGMSVDEYVKWRDVD